MSRPVPRVVVLVEGASDAAALDVLAARRGLLPDAGFAIVDMGGVTNVRRELGRALPGPVLGLCDAGEVRFVRRALEAYGDVLADDSPEELRRRGWYVCDRDLEEELIRAVGPAECLQAISDLGDLGRFRSFQRQPEWRLRDVPDQLHRFAGTASGRKRQFAARLAAGVSEQALPAPLAGVLARLADLVGDPTEVA